MLRRHINCRIIIIIIIINRAIHGSVWPYDLEKLRYVLRSALGKFFTKFDLRQLIRAWITALFYAYTLCRAVTLTFVWPVDLKSSWDIKHHVIKVCTKFERNRTISGWIIDNLANFSTRYVTLRWPLISWPWTFIALRVSCVLCTKYERNRIIHRWVVDDLARYLCNFRGGARLTNGSQGCVNPTLPNPARTGRFLHKKFGSAFGYLAAFSNGSGSKLSDVENDAKLRTFWSPLKIGGGVGEICLPILLKIYLRLNMWWPHARLLIYGLIKNKERNEI